MKWTGSGASLRGLIETIELRPSAEANDILLRGDLAGILTLARGN